MEKHECYIADTTSLPPDLAPSSFRLSGYGEPVRYHWTTNGKEDPGEVAALNTAWDDMPTVQGKKVIYPTKVEVDDVIWVDHQMDLRNAAAMSSAEPHGNAIWMHFREATPRDFGRDQISSRIERLTIPQRWREEKIAPPSLECRRKTSRLCIDIRDTYGLYPDWIAPSKIGGIYVLYRHIYTERCLSLEIDNDLDCICQVFDRTNIYLTADVDSGREVLSLAFDLFNE